MSVLHNLKCFANTNMLCVRWSVECIYANEIRSFHYAYAILSAYLQWHNQNMVLTWFLLYEHSQKMWLLRRLLRCILVYIIGVPQSHKL